MGRAHISTNAPYNFLHFHQQYTVHIMALREKIEPDFLMCACADYSVVIFPGKYVHIYYGRAAQTDMAALLARGGSNRQRVYIT